MKREKFWFALIGVLCVCMVVFGCYYGRLYAKISSDSICIKDRFTGIEKMLGEDEVKEVLSILNDGDWQWGQLDLYCTHEFIMDTDEEIWYDTSGTIMDLKRNRYIYAVTEEQKDYLNSLIPVGKVNSESNNDLS